MSLGLLMIPESAIFAFGRVDRFDRTLARGDVTTVRCSGRQQRRVERTQERGKGKGGTNEYIVLRLCSYCIEQNERREKKTS
jgi:hypothetical protein